MKEQNRNLERLELVSSDKTSRGGERKRRRLAATIAAPEQNRPRLQAQACTAAVFNSGSWRKRWSGIRPVAETVGLYVAGCTGSMRLGGLLGMPVLKPGTAQNVPARIRKLNSEQYGSQVITDFTMHDEPGWDDWEPSKLSAVATHPASPVRVLPRQLNVELPFWVSASDFESLVVAALDPITLVAIAATPAGRDLCRRRGIAVDALLRYSRAAHGPVLATEIGVVAPSGDASRLITIVEWILIRLVMADGDWEG